MENRRLRKSTIYLLYSLGFVLLVGIAYLIEGLYQNKSLKNDTEYVNSTILSKDVKPVVALSPTLIRPYKDEEVKILKNYYDYHDSEEEQENSIIVYNNTYLQNSGICYGSKEFDVVAILDGKVISVKEDELLGLTVEIEHNNNIISVYQSLKDINVKEGDMISQGDIIGKSGSNNLNKDLNDHLHFELIINGTNVDPENYYDKTVDEIKG